MAKEEEIRTANRQEAHEFIDRYLDAEEEQVAFFHKLYGVYSVRIKKAWTVEATFDEFALSSPESDCASE